MCLFFFITTHYSTRPAKQHACLHYCFTFGVVYGHGTRCTNGCYLPKQLLVQKSIVAEAILYVITMRELDFPAKGRVCAVFRYLIDNKELGADDFRPGFFELLAVNRTRGKEQKRGDDKAQADCLNTWLYSVSGAAKGLRGERATHSAAVALAPPTKRTRSTFAAQSISDAGVSPAMQFCEAVKAPSGAFATLRRRRRRR